MGAHGGIRSGLNIWVELDLEGVAVGVDVNNRSDVANFQTLGGHRDDHNDGIVLSYHFEGFLPTQGGSIPPRSSSIS